ncbi:unnamed protein product [Lactuca saligna]|uniref:GRF-type domain-containing protein n=1 Tax=Lactuca saligna TaxID=75948 RepID=A0AA36A5A2_LACSI|nr:unnamed protein product [Lactuca saligna]
MNRLRKRCYCGDPVGRWTSLTPLNLGRRFIGCPNYQNGLKDCKYFRWVDPPLPSQWYADLLLVLHNNVNLDNHRIFGEFGQEQPTGNFLETLWNNQWHNNQLHTKQWKEEDGNHCFMSL